jgi:phenylacetate-CoA ligase
MRNVYHFLNSYRGLKLRKEKILGITLKRIKKIAFHAYHNVPFYHKIMKENGIRPTDIRNFEDLKKLPIISKQIVKKNYNDFICDSIPTFMVRSTSGTTGVSLKLQYDKNYVQSMDHLLLRSLFAIGYKPWWKILYFHFLDDKLSKTDKILSSFGLFRRKFINIKNFNVKNLKKEIENFNPNIISGSFSLALPLLLKLDIKLDKKIFMTGGEVITEKMKEHVVNKLNLSNLYEGYGSWEFGYVAWECKEHSGLHLNLDYDFVEFLDKNNDYVSPNEKGRIVITNLFNVKMPLLRYEIGDVGIPIDEKCNCGVELPMVKNVSRIDKHDKRI